MSVQKLRIGMIAKLAVKVLLIPGAVRVSRVLPSGTGCSGTLDEAESMQLTVA